MVKARHIKGATTLLRATQVAVGGEHVTRGGSMAPWNAQQTVVLNWVQYSNAPEQAFWWVLPLVSVANGQVQTVGKGKFSNALHGEHQNVKNERPLLSKGCH